MSMRWMILTALFLLIFAGCTQKSQTPLPQSVAKEFWSSLQKGDLHKAKSLTIRGRIDEPLLKVQLKRVEIEGTRAVNGRAFVYTRLFFDDPVDSSAGECNATVDTELLKVEGRWLVDDVVTMQNYDEALGKGVAKCASKMLERAVEMGVENFESIKKEFQDNFSGLAKELEESFKTIQRELKESLERMQNELQKEPPKLPEPAEGDRI